MQITITTDKDSKLKAKLEEFKKEIDDLALKNIEAAAEISRGRDDPAYSGPALMAMFEFERLKMTRDFDLITILLQGESLSKISKMNLWTQLPGDYQSAEEAVEVETHLSKSVQSNIKDLYTVVFPYVINNLGMSLTEFWNSMSFSNLREIVPHLKYLITGQESRRSVIDAIESIRENLGLPETGEEKVIVEEIIETAQNNRNRDLRSTLRPGEPQPILAALLRRDGACYMVAELDPDAQARVQSMKAFDLQPVDLDQYQPHKVPVVKQLLGAQLIKKLEE